MNKNEITSDYVVNLRISYGLTEVGFASYLNLSVDELRAIEAGDIDINGPLLVVIVLIDKHGLSIFN